MRDEAEETSVRERKLSRAAELFRLLADGDPDVTPASFDRVMAELGLTPEDIDKTPDEITTAKKQSDAGWGRRVFRLLTGGNAFGPAYFDSQMAELGLTPDDIGETAETIAAAKERWEMMRQVHCDAAVQQRKLIARRMRFWSWGVLALELLVVAAAWIFLMALMILGFVRR